MYMRLTFYLVKMSATFQHKSKPEDNLRGEGRVHAADSTPTQQLMDNVQYIHPL